MGEFSPFIFPYVLIEPFDTNSTVSSSLFAAMSSSTPPPFSYPITSTSGPFVPSTLAFPLVHSHHPLVDLVQHFILEWDLHQL